MVSILTDCVSSKAYDEQPVRHAPFRARRQHRRESTESP